MVSGIGKGGGGGGILFFHNHDLTAVFKKNIWVKCEEKLLIFHVQNINNLIFVSCEINYSRLGMVEV